MLFSQSSITISSNQSLQNFEFQPQMASLLPTKSISSSSMTKVNYIINSFNSPKTNSLTQQVIYQCSNFHHINNHKTYISCQLPQNISHKTYPIDNKITSHQAKPRQIIFNGFYSFFFQHRKRSLIQHTLQQNAKHLISVIRKKKPHINKTT